MNWREIMKGEAPEMHPQYPQYPQYPTEIGNFEDFEDFEDEVLSLVQQSCNGFAITPDQFLVLTTKEDRELILSGDLPIEMLRAYAKSFAEGIQTGRITFHPKFNHGICHET